MKIRVIKILVFIFVFQYGIGQSNDFTLDDFYQTGDTRISDRCFQLTEDVLWQGGGVWFKKPVDLSESFNMEIEVNFGCRDEGGADGIVFIFHPELRTGSRGEGMGFGRLYPSFGVEMDTYMNEHLADPYYDHVALMQHGSLFHYYGITEPIRLSDRSDNVEDCKSHFVEIDWNASTKTFRFFFDGAIRISEKIDIVKDLFEGDPQVYWGFTSATGGKTNKHLVCVKKLEFTETFALSPKIKTQLLSGRNYILQNLDFPSGSYVVPDAAKPELDKLVKFFQENPKHTIFLDGFTDSSGSESGNQRISELRAKAIATYFESKGISSARLQYFGNGEMNPIAPNNTEEGRKKNRRVEIIMRVLKV